MSLMGVFLVSGGGINGGDLRLLAIPSIILLPCFSISSVLNRADGLRACGRAAGVEGKTASEKGVEGKTASEKQREREREKEREREMSARF